MKVMHIHATNRSTGLKLIGQTRGRRHQWIITDKLNVCNVLEVFPLLKDPIIVSIFTRSVKKLVLEIIVSERKLGSH